MKITATLIKRVKSMSEHSDSGTISTTLQIPTDIVEKILADQLEITPGRKTEIVKSVRFVRNKTIAAISPVGGTGKTTILSTLAILQAVASKHRTVIVDFSRTGNIAVHLGVELTEELIGKTNQHPQLTNLYFLRLPPPTIAYDVGDEEEIIKLLQQKFETVFIDTDHIIPGVDAWLLVTSTDVFSVPGLQYLLSKDLLNTVVIFNRADPIAITTNLKTFFLASDKRLLKISKRAALVLRQKSTPFTKALQELHNYLFPGQVITKKTFMEKVKIRFLKIRPRIKRIKLVKRSKSPKPKTEQATKTRQRKGLLTRLFAFFDKLSTIVTDLIWITGLMAIIPVVIYLVYEYGSIAGWEVDFLRIPVEWIKTVLNVMKGGGAG